MIQAIVFDMDGVLVDAVKWHFTALNQALSHFGYGISFEDHQKFLNGIPTRKKLEFLSRERGLPLELHGPIERLKQERTRTILEQACVPSFRLTQTLAELQRLGYRLAVASNSVRETVDRVMRGMNIGRFFEFALSNQDVREPKPNPEIYFKALNRLGVTASQAMIVEDSSPGIEAAKKVTPHVLVVASPEDVNLERIRGFLHPLQYPLALDLPKPSLSR